MNRYVKQLKIIQSKKLSVDKAKELGINIQELRNRGFIIIDTIKNEDVTIPKGVPKYAAKFGFTRKKYGISVNVTEEKHIKITDRGIKFLAKSAKKQEDPIDPKPKQKTIDIEADNENQDQQSI